MRIRLLGSALACIAAMGFAALVTGCDDNNVTCSGSSGGDCTPIGTTCGTGTKLADGQCVPDTSGCGAGTKQDDTGACVADPTTVCGNGTQYDTTKQTCVSTSDVQCGDGTTLTDGVCVSNTTPPINPTCGTGTVLQNNQCVPSSTTTCGVGTVLVDGQCVPSTPCGANQIVVNGGCVAAGYVQLVNNYSAIASADIYVDGTVAASAVAFQTASAFVGVDVSTPHTVQIVAAGAAAPTDALTTLTLAQGDMIALVITDSQTTGPTAVKVPAAQVAGTGTSAFGVADVSPDLNGVTFTVGLYDVLTGSSTISPTSLSFGEATTSPITPPGRTVAFDLWNASHSQFIGQFQTSSGSALPIVTEVSSSSGVAAVVLVSGHHSGSDFGVFAVPAAGGAFERLDVAARVQVIRASAVPATADVYINNALASDAMPDARATAFLPVVAGAPVTIAFNDDSTNHLGDAPTGGQLIAQTYTFAANVASIVVQYGNEGAPTPGDMALKMLDFPGRTAGTSPTSIDIAAFNGLVGSSPTDIVAAGYGAPSVAYGSDQPYTTIAPEIETFTLSIDSSNEFALDFRGRQPVAGVLIVDGSVASPSMFFASASGAVFLATTQPQP